MTTVLLDDVVRALDTELRITEVPDFPGAVNGLQIANGGTVSHVATAVDASRTTIDAAVAIGADMLIVHHGLFWGGVQPFTGIAYRKYQALFAHGIAVYGAHIPLDCHPTLGNNVLLARDVELAPSGGFARYKTMDIGVRGESDVATDELRDRLQRAVARYGGVVRSSIDTTGRRTRRWAMCSGSGASTETLREARDAGIDTLITGEGPHHTTVDAIDSDLCILYAGHYATETLGVQAAGAWLARRFGIRTTFLNLPTGS